MNLLNILAAIFLITLSAIVHSKEIENISDLGFTPDEYAERFNGHIEQLEMPFVLDASISDEQVDEQAVFGSVFLNVVSIIGTANPDSQLVNSLVLNGMGDGTDESGEFIIAMFATAIASLNAGEFTDKPLGIVLGLVDGMQKSPDSIANTVIDDIEYSASNSPYTGVMLTISPVK